MINIFLSVMMILSSICLFSITYRINGLNRTIMDAPISIFEYAIPVVTNLEEIELVFDQNNLKKKYQEYLDTTIFKYVSSYELSYRFYFPETMASCRNNCKGVEITLDAPLLITYNFHRTMYYEIKEVN